MPDESAIINIDVLLPKDIVFEARDAYGKKINLAVRGDLPVRIGLELSRLLDETQAAITDGSVEAMVRCSGDLHAFLLPIFQERHPKLTELPWGTIGLNRVANVMLARVLGFSDEGLKVIGGQGSEEADPPTNRAARRSAARSTPRSGSAASQRSTGGRPRSG